MLKAAMHEGQRPILQWVLYVNRTSFFVVVLVFFFKFYILVCCAGRCAFHSSTKIFKGIKTCKEINHFTELKSICFLN